VLFPTATFAIFFMAVLPLSWLLQRRPERWRPFIVTASFVFYAGWDWRFCFLLAFSILWNHVLATAIHRRSSPRARKQFLVIALVGNVGLLGYFKYYDFFVTSTNNLFALVGVDLPLEARSIVLPVGISFFTFMGIAYIVDVYRGDFEPVRLGPFAAYLSFFPHLVAGPIVRPWELIPQFDSPRDPRRVDAGRAYYLIATGLFKKVVIANYLATQIVDPVFGAPNDHSSPEVLVAVVAYAVQIYADFSGYTDMAIGIALLLGFQFPQNFDSPYAATSLRDFWRRWHMTLSRWLRDYLYIPLGGSRKGPLVTYRNLMLTMLLGGLWHGAGWTFVAWGGIHGAGLVVERLRLDRRRAKGLPDPPDTALRRATARLLTFSVVCFAWIFFRADSFADARDMIVRLFTDWGSGAPLVTFPVLLAIAAGIGSQYLPARVPKLIMARLAALSPVPQAAVLAAALRVTNAMGPQGVAPFIYFRF
jgi:alginate O-acetyltransferase complex protein AlgI